MKTLNLIFAVALGFTMSLTFSACGDDEVATPESTLPTNNFYWVDKSTNTVFTKSNVEVGSIITLYCRDSEDNFPSLTNVNADYDMTYVKVELAKGAGGRQMVSIRGVAEVEETEIKLTYTYNGNEFTDKLKVKVTPVNTDAKDKARRSELQKFFNSQTGKESPIDLTVRTVVVPDYLESDNGVMILTHKTQDVSSTEKEFMPISNKDIYPGSLVYINADLANGQPTPVSFQCSRPAGNVTVYVTFLIAGTPQVAKHNVPNTPADIHQAINDLLSGSLGTGKSVPPADLAKETTCSNSTDKMALDLGCSLSFLGAKCNVQTNISKEQSKIYQMDTFNQNFYTVYVQPENMDRTNLVGLDVTADMIKNKESANGRIGIIRSVTYGRFGYYKREYEKSSFSFKGSETVSYSTNFKGESKQDISNFAESTRESSRIYGGDPSASGKAMANRDAFMTEMLNSTVVSINNQGHPIFYEVEYLSTGKSAQMKRTGKINDISAYVPAPNRLVFSIHNGIDLTHWNGNDKLLVDIMYSTFTLVNGKKVPKKQDYSVSLHRWDGVRGTYDGLLQLDKGEYFEREATISIWLKGYYDDKWSLKSQGKIDISDGNLKLDIKGSTNSPTLNPGTAPDLYDTYLTK